MALGFFCFLMPEEFTRKSKATLFHYVEIST